MLVLSRGKSESVMIGDDIEITVVSFSDGKVRIGINAPKEIAVHRREIYEAIQRENRAAAMVRVEDFARTLGGVPAPMGVGR